MFELLKEKSTGNIKDSINVIGLFFGCVMILIAFIQLIGLIFEPDVCPQNLLLFRNMPGMISSS